MQTLPPTLFKALLLLALSVAPTAWAADPKPASSATTSAAACPAVLRHTVERLQDEKPQNLCQYAGQVVVVVNKA